MDSSENEVVHAIPEVRRSNVGLFGAAFLITNAALGAGLLNFPRAFHESGGLIPGNLLHLYFSLNTLGSLYMMTVIADKHGSKTYQEMVKQQCGAALGNFTAACIAAYCLITCITFIIIVGDQTDRFFADLYGPSFCTSWWLNRTFTMIVAGLIVLGLSLFRDMATLVTLGYVGSVFMAYMVIVIVWVYATGTYSPGQILIFDTQQWSHIFEVLPTICFGYQCHVSSVPIYHSIKDRNRRRYFQVSITIIGLAIKSLTTYPVLMFCVREAVVTFYQNCRPMTRSQAAATEAWRRYVIVTVLWLISVSAALFAKNIEVVVRLLGSLAVFFIFILPGCCMLSHCLERSPYGVIVEEDNCLLPTESVFCLSRVKKKIGIVSSIYFIVIGAFTFGLSVTLALEIVFSTEESHAALCVPQDSLFWLQNATYHSF